MKTNLNPIYQDPIKDLLQYTIYLTIFESMLLKYLHVMAPHLFLTLRVGKISSDQIFIDENKISIDENENLNHDSSLKKPLSLVNHMFHVPAIKFLGFYFDPALNFK